MAGVHLEMALNVQKVVSDWEVDVGSHGMRWKLEEWGWVMVGQPQQQSTIIGAHPKCP